TEDPLSFAKKLGIRYALAVASDEVKSKFGGIEGLPTTMLYDRQGKLREKIIGFEYTKVIESELKPLFLCPPPWGVSLQAVKRSGPFKPSLPRSGGCCNLLFERTFDFCLNRCTGSPMKIYNVYGYLIILCYALACMFSAPAQLGPWKGLFL